MEKTEFQSNIAALRKQLDAGDIEKICKKAKCTTGTFYNAVRKTDAKLLSKTESAVISALIEFVDAKTARKEELNQRAAEMVAQLP